MIASSFKTSVTPSNKSTDMPSEDAEVDELVHTWMIHHIQIIGEAANKLTPAFRRTHPQVPWPLIIKMRHVLIHDYFGIDLAEVWAVVERDLPALKRQINQILKQSPRRRDTK